MARFLLGLASLAAALPCLESVCPFSSVLPTQRGDGHCDLSCMSPMCGFDAGVDEVSDCLGQCEPLCTASMLEDGSCQPGNVHPECLRAECGWDFRDCGYCQADCMLYTGLWTELGNGVCSPQCSSPTCNYDGGDCLTAENPLTVYVSAALGGDSRGSWALPYRSLYQALTELWAPYTRVYLLDGTHPLEPIEAFTYVSFTGKSVLIQTLMCTGRPGDHMECAESPASIQLSPAHIGFDISHQFVLKDLEIRGGFSLLPGCDEEYCTYCPDIRRNLADGLLYTDQGDRIEEGHFAPQSLCDVYQKDYLFQLLPTAELTLSNVLFYYIRHQLQALIISNCADIVFEKVTFSDIMARRLGLEGGVIQQISTSANEPYSCGSFHYTSGLVELLNNGYEYSPTSYFSGFAWLSASKAIAIRAVRFQYNYMIVGKQQQVLGSALLYFTRFRTLVVENCTFAYNLADSGAALYVYSSLDLPLVIGKDGRAQEQLLTHITISDCIFLSNAGRKGSVLFLQFLRDQQNVLIQNCSFLSNFATEMGVLDIVNGFLQDKYTIGETIEVLEGNVVRAVSISPRWIRVENCQFKGNYAPYLSFSRYIANLSIANCSFEDVGNSAQSLSYSHVLTAYIESPRTYPNLVPSDALPTDCLAVLYIEDGFTLNLENLDFRYMLCPNGSPGVTIAGDNWGIDVFNLTFQHSSGDSLLSLSSNVGLQLSSLHFINNTSTSTDRPVCLSIYCRGGVKLWDSEFRDNAGVFATVGTVQALGLEMASVRIASNTAKSASAGIIYTPLITANSHFTVRYCVFSDNVSYRSGMLTVSEVSGNMQIAGKYLRISIENCSFEDNWSTYGGCSLTLAGLLALTADSTVKDCIYKGNSCGEGGAALYGGFVQGILTFSGSEFEANSGTDGAAVLSTHIGAENTSLSFTNCVFLRNTGNSVVSLKGINVPTIYTLRSNFTSNHCTCISLLAATWHDSISTYSHNTGLRGTVFEALQGSSAYLQHLTAENNTATETGGVGSISTDSELQCTNCSMRNNRSKGPGGVFAVDQHSLLVCGSCDVRGNQATGPGSFLYASLSDAIVRNSSLNSNSAGDFGLAALTESSLILSNCLISSNTAQFRSSGFVLSLSNLTISRSTVSNQTSDTGGAVFAVVSSSVNIEKSRFFDISANSGGVFYLAVFSSLAITDSHISHCKGVNDGSVAIVKDSNTQLNAVIISDCETLKSSAAFFASQSNITVTHSTFVRLRGSALQVQTCRVRIGTSEFGQLAAINGAGLNCLDCPHVQVEGSNFSASVARYGGAIYCFTAGFMSTSLYLNLTNNLFLDNKGVNGAAVYTDGFYVDLRGNSFLHNDANSQNYPSEGLLNLGIGGALFLRNQFTLTIDVAAENNTFGSNTAERQGGAIYWFDDYPEIRNNVFDNNSAPYGDNIAAFPVRLAMLSANNQPLPYVNNESIPLTTTLVEVASGQTFSSILTFALIDQYGKVVFDDSDTPGQVLSPNRSLITVAGNSQVSSISGVFTFSELVFTGEPGSTQLVLVSSPGVDLGLKDYTNDPNTYYPSVSIEISFRQCVMGESIQEKRCYPCAPGTFNLDPTEPCNSCPAHAICYGNFTMAPKSGYWRPDARLNLFFVCLLPEACLGSPTDLPQVSLTGICEEGYYGNLCSTCMSGFSRKGKYECGKCPKLASNIVVSVLIVVLALILGGIIIVVAVRGAGKPRSELAVLVKIFMNYLQMVVVAASLNLNWPDFVAIFLNGQDTAGSMTEQLFSFDCIMQDMDVKGVYYTKLAGSAMMPAALLLFCLGVWGLISICSRIERLIHKLVASLVMILFVLHPSLTKAMFSLFSCFQLKPSELWLVSDLSLQCWTQEHIKNILMVSIPSITVWIFGLPFLCLVLLYRYRKRLADPLVQLKFSFLYKGYHAEWYFWEFVILYRKVAVVCASVFLSTVSIMVQALSVLAVLLVALFTQLQVQPFLSNQLNRLELKSILVSSVTIYCGLFYETESLSTFHPAIEVKVLLFAAILASNAYFLLNWFRAILPLLLETLRRRFFCAKRHYNVQPISKAGFLDSGNLSGTSKATRWERDFDQSESQSHASPMDNTPPANTPQAMEAEVTFPEGRLQGEEPVSPN